MPVAPRVATNVHSCPTAVTHSAVAAIPAGAHDSLRWVAEIIVLGSELHPIHYGRITQPPSLSRKSMGIMTNEILAVRPQFASSTAE
jgi:hypothetical protein